MNGTKSFTPREFLDGLRKDEIQAPIVMYGMVKPAEDDDQYLLFAHGTMCDNWIRVPLTSIETVELVKFAPCKDHRHPLVLLHLKQPETEEGRLLASLVQRTSRRGPRRAPRIIRGPGSFKPRRSSADPDAGSSARSEWEWCDSLPAYEMDEAGNVYCMDWCWESEHQALYSQC